MDDTGPVQWRRDASTSLTVRLLWTLGAGTFIGAIILVATARVFALAGRTTSQSPMDPFTTAQLVIVAVLATMALITLILAFAHYLGLGIPYADDDSSLERALDAGVGGVVMGSIIIALVTLAGDPGRLLAAATLPLALVSLALSASLRSTGALDANKGLLYLYEPNDVIEIEYLEDVSARYLGDTAIVTLQYHEPDNAYVPGPRRLILPPGVARDLEAMVGAD